MGRKVFREIFIGKEVKRAFILLCMEEARTDVFFSEKYKGMEVLK